ncbi:unnamed protein product [Penicillium roqueforti FM164]|uniref:Genomic scaffold, ProqFM164S01 n=1 Tax=Penicillium roqueforti (strain FM164) TaxID=1365484 RepID=W6Q9R2_PENRF|nr:unnamed protein product [Penicillium roqueforti FM164]
MQGIIYSSADSESSPVVGTVREAVAERGGGLLLLERGQIGGRCLKGIRFVRDSPEA